MGRLRQTTEWLATALFAPGMDSDTLSLEAAAKKTTEEQGFARVEQRDLLARIAARLTPIQCKLLYACAILGVSKRDLAAHAKVSHATIYHEFKMIRKVAAQMLKDDDLYKSVEYKTGTRTRTKGRTR